MIALADIRSATPQPRPLVLLGGSGRTMHGAGTAGPFAIVTQNLIRLGACPLERLAGSPRADLEGFDLPYANGAPQVELVTVSGFGSGSGEKQALKDEKLDVGVSAPIDLTFSPGDTTEDNGRAEQRSAQMQFVAQLYKTCNQAFGNSEALNFEFIEEDGPDHKQCILTIKRPNGTSRSYTSEADFKRKSDAKARVAALAVEMGAIDFILYGNKDKLKSHVPLAPIEGKTVQESKMEEVAPEISEDEDSKLIQECCVEWRAGRVHPRWTYYSEHKGSTQHGCVLVIELSSHLQRIYSVKPMYESRPAAKKQCSELAVRQGVLEFIKYGNGQAAPAATPVQPLEHVIIQEERPLPEKKGRAGALSLQAFFDTLPKPFPEPIGDKTVSEVNAPGILNNTLQLAKGAKLSLQFYFFNEGGLHGCILRLERPEETRTYMVEAKFSKRPDAKAAVCLLSMSQGINQYIRNIATAVESKITPEMRKMANEQILPILGSEYAKLRHGMHPSYEYDHEHGAFGCTLVLALSAEAKEEDMKKWSVPTEYRTKADAKIAVVCKAGSEAIEFVRFRGQPPPPDHDPFKPYRRPKEGAQVPESGKKGDGRAEVKREEGSPSLKSPTTSGDRPLPKRQGSTSGQVRLGLPLLETKEEGLARQKVDGAKWPKKGHPQKSRTGSFAQNPPAPYGPPSSAYGRPYDVSAAASAVIDRFTGSPVVPLAQTPPAPPPHMHALHPPPPPPPPYGVNPYPPVAYPPDAHAFPPMPPYPPQPSYYHHHQSPPNPYQMSAAGYPPVYGGVPGPSAPPLTAYYSDPLVPHYASPAPYPPPPPQPAYPPTPYVYAQPSHAHSPYAPQDDRATGAPPAQHPADAQTRHAQSNASPPYRSTSFSTPKDRQKRPRSRERTPSDAQVPKKQRSESSLPTERNSRSRRSPSERTESPPPAKAYSNGTPNTSNVTQLFDYCADERLPRPEFSHKVVTGEDGQEMYKVWIVLGKERLELPTLFHSMNEGKQRLAKQVLQRLRSQSRGGDQSYR